MRSFKVFAVWLLLLLFYPAMGCTLRLVDERSSGQEDFCPADSSIEAAASVPGDAQADAADMRMQVTVDASMDVRLADATARDVVGVDAAQVPITLEGPDFVVLAPTTCSDRRLHLPMVHVAPDRDLWHFCYVGPGNHERQSLPVHDRPTAYTFTRWNGVTSPLVELGSATAPRTADPWTASVLVSLPRTPAVFPLFNVRTESPMGFGWASVPDPGAIGFRMSGNFRAWRVGADGVQVPAALGFTRSSCEPLLAGLEVPAASFVPLQSLCPHVLETCPLPEDPCLY